MKKNYFLILMAVWALTAGCNKTMVFVEDGQAVDLQRKHRLNSSEGYLSCRQAGSKIPYFAGKMISSESWRIRTEMNIVPAREDQQEHIGAAFVFGQNSILLDGEGNKIMASGPELGNHDLGPVEGRLEYGKDFSFDLELKAGKLGISIDDNQVAELDFHTDGEWLPLRFGFNPGDAVINVKAFEASAGKFTDIELLTYSIPQIDLDDREDLQVVVARDSTEYYGHPSSVILDDGKTITIMYLTGHAFGAPRWKRSYDGGLTWSEHLPLPDQWFHVPEYEGHKYRRKTAFAETPTLYRFPNVPGADRVCMYTGRYPSRYALSDDGGASWSELRPLLLGGEQYDSSVVLFSDIIRLDDGTSLATFHKRVQGINIVFKTSTSDGKSFSKPEPMASLDRAGLCEAEFVRSPDGKRIALLMRENYRQYQSFISFSEDEGKTWSTPREVPPALTGDRHKAVYVPDGRLMISFRDRGHDSPTFGSWVAWVGTFEDLEKGHEGQYRIFLKKNSRGTDCAYPTVHLLSDGTIFLATYGQWVPDTPNFILSCRLNMEELDRLYEDLTKK